MVNARHRAATFVANNVVSTYIPLKRWRAIPMRAGTFSSVFRPLPVAAIAGAALVAVALGLWVHYGTAVFIETIQAGLAGCF